MNLSIYIIFLPGSAGLVGDGTHVFGTVSLRQLSGGLSAVSQRPVQRNGPVRNDSGRRERILCRDCRTYRCLTSPNEMMKRIAQSDILYGYTKHSGVRRLLDWLWEWNNHTSKCITNHEEDKSLCAGEGPWTDLSHKCWTESVNQICRRANVSDCDFISGFWRGDYQTKDILFVCVWVLC